MAEQEKRWAIRHDPGEFGVRPVRSEIGGPSTEGRSVEVVPASTLEAAEEKHAEAERLCGIACEKRDAAEAETKAAESRCKGLTQALSTVLGFLDMDDAETHKGIAENCGVDACIVCLAEEVARTALKEH